MATGLEVEPALPRTEPSWFGRRVTLCCAFLAAGSLSLSAQQPLSPKPTPLRACEATAISGRAPACALLIELSQSDTGLTSNRLAANVQNIRARQLVEARPSESLAWYVLGLSDLVAASAGVIAREGPLQPSGTSHEAAAGRAFIRALTLDTALVAAAEALAMTPRPREGVAELAIWVPVLRRYRPRLSGVAAFAAAKVDREAGTPTEALRWLDAATRQRDVPIGVIQLERTRVLYLAGQPDAAARALFAGAADTAAASVRAYCDVLAMVASPEEIQQWDAVGAEGRADALRAFWFGRDAHDGWPPGTRLTIHYQRLETAWARYRLTIPATGRHKVSSVARNFDFFAEELLQRYYADHFVEYGDLVRLDQERGVLGNRALYRAFLGSLEELDDRGLILIRHGEPDKRARTVGGEALELWLYQQGDQPLLLSFREEDFDGQAGASVLVPSVMSADPLQRQQLCHLDTRLCPLDSDPRSQEIKMLSGGTVIPGSSGRGIGEVARLGSGVLLAQARLEGQSAIATATTSDGNRHTSAEELGTHAVFHGVARPGAGAVLVVPFAIPGQRLEGEAIPGAAGRTGYPLRFVIEAARRSDGLVRRIDTLRFFAASHPLGKGEYLSGVLELAVLPGSYVASVVVTQADDRGSVSSISAVEAPDFGTLGISDVVLGKHGSGVVWKSGGKDVPLNPLGGFVSGGTAEVYYQLFQFPVGTPYRTRIELWTADRKEAAPRLSIGFDGRSSGPLTEVSQTLELRELGVGRYRLRVVVSVAGRELSAESWLTVVKQ